MIYTKAKREPQVLHRGNCNGYDYCIVSFGSHPCAYIAAPKLEYFGYDFVQLDVHGGITYACYCPDLNYVWSYGWDYAHAGDYHGRETLRTKWALKGKKWTTEEILEDVEKACHELPDVQRDILDKYGKYQKPGGTVPMTPETMERLQKCFDDLLLSGKRLMGEIEK